MDMENTSNNFTSIPSSEQFEFAQPRSSMLSTSTFSVSSTILAAIKNTTASDVNETPDPNMVTISTSVSIDSLVHQTKVDNVISEQIKKKSSQVCCVGENNFEMEGY